MKQFIDKLIERLEEISVENTCSDCPYKAKCDEVQEHINDETTDLCGATIKALSIEIVNQLAEEYNNDVCEWKSEKDMFIQNPHTGRKFSNEPSMRNVYCNTCGKKIKVAPYQPKGE